jgi:phosphate/phosphite/phosphonate ABC transporter binding protein
MAHDVFISYSSRDKAVADSIVAALELNNVRCWYAPRDIKPGADWGEEIARAVSESRVFLIIFSKYANGSQRVLDELNLAISKELVIIPFRIEKLEPSGAMLLHLSTRHWLDAFVPSWEKHIDELVNSVLVNLGGSKIEVRHADSKGYRNKKRLVWLVSCLISLVLLGVGVVFGLPKLFAPQVVVTNAPQPTIPRTQAATFPPTPLGPALGTSENPIIWMYVPPAELDFAEISAIADQIVSTFSLEYPDLKMKAIPATDKGSITQALCDAEVQIGFLGPFSYLMASDQGCAEAKLIWSREITGITYGGMVIVNADSNISSIEELRGKTLCTPANSVSGWVLPSLEIRAAYGDPFIFFGEIIQLASHAEVIEKVYNRECDAGTTYYDSRQMFLHPDAIEQLVVILTTVTIPNTNISFSAEIDSQLSRFLVEFFLNLSKESEQFAKLCGFYNTTDPSRLIEINDYYYNGIRDLLQRAGSTPDEFLASDR